MSSPGQLPPVLLVDDNADDLFIMRQRLLRGGLQNPIVAFEESEEALVYLKNLTAGKTTLPCVVFLDLRMPRCGGFEFLKWVRAQPALMDLPVFIVSTSSLPEDALRARQLGAAAFLAKFPAPEVLAEVVQAAMRQLAS